jgi:uncharacterized membrane protein YfcA
MMLNILLALLALAAAFNGLVLVRAAIAQRVWPGAEAAVLGAIVNFLDTLGIGSMAPTMAWFKFRKLVPDHLIPQTMITGLTLPTMVEGLIFLSLLGVGVDPVLLVGSILAFLAGGWAGLPLIARAKAWVVQGVVGIALLIAAGFFLLSNLDLMPVGGTAASLPPGLTIVAIAASFGFGVLINFGVGNYAPSLAMLSLMGLDPRLCFPIMAASASFAAAGIATHHIKAGKIDLRIPLAMVLAGIPAVLFAALIVKSLPLAPLKWLVSVVVTYTGIVMLRSAASGRQADAETSGPVAQNPAPPA